MKAPSISIVRPSLSSLAFGLVALSLPVMARAQNATQGRITTYSGSNLSIWSPGRDTGDNLGKILIGPDISIHDTELGGIGELIIPEINLGLIVIPSYSLGRTGARIRFGGNVRAGITFQPWYTGGRLQYNYRASVDVTFPRLPEKDKSTTITARFRGASGDFTASSPGFGGSFGAVGQIDGYANTEAWFLGQRLFDGTIFNFSERPAEVALGGRVNFTVPDQVNTLVSELNPTPIGVEITNPEIETHAAGVGSDGSMHTTGFGKFLSVETNLLDWMLLLLPRPAAEAIGHAASGNYSVPATNYRVGWDFCKSWANLDVGLYSDHTLRPSTSAPPVINLKVYNARTGALLANRDGGSATFTMPEDGVRVVPTLTARLSFRNRLSVGTGGSIGTEPIRISSAGTYGSGSDIRSLNFDFSVGNFVWAGDPSAGTKILEDEFALPEPDGGWTRELPPVGIRAFDGNELPREVFGTAGTSTTAAALPVEIPAFSYDVATGDINRDRKEVTIVPEQGRAFFASRASFSATLVKNDGTTSAIELKGNPTTFDDGVRLNLATKSLSPGQHTIRLTVAAINLTGAPVQATYTVPLTCYNPRVSVSPALFSRADLQPNSNINRVEADGLDQRIYLGGAKGLLPTTEMVLDDGTVVENDWYLKSELTLAGQMSNGVGISIVLTPAQKAAMAGAPHTLKLHAPSIIRGADGTQLPPFESAAIPIFVVAGVPSISGISYNDEAVASLPFGKGGLSFDLKGTNFSRATKVYFNVAGQAAGAAEAVPADFTSEGVMRVRLSGTLVKRIHDLGRTAFTLRAETPTVNVPADAGHPARTSGGTSATATIGMTYPKPALNRIAPTSNPDEALSRVRGVDASVRIFGDNLFVPQANNGNAVTTTVRFAGAVLTATPGRLHDDGLTVQYLDVVIPAGDDNSTNAFSATNPGQDNFGFFYSLQNVNARPELRSVGTNARIRIGKDLTTTSLVGGPIYDGATKLVLGGQELSVERTSASGANLTGDGGTFRNVPGKTAEALLRNPAPAGGDSRRISVILEEGDANTISVTKGVLAFDRASNAWKQEITLTYRGTRTLDGNVNLQFDGLREAQLLNGNGTDEGRPFRRVSMAAGSTVKLVALFRKTGTNPISYETRVRIP